ncbi:lon protease family protein [Cyclospora cayetanensis]|uniref:Lon protease homolog n=1 Tax=Cyclospora cayetanensis TaxID=88456 RepID=A0A1D3CZ41_9EIME|nr:lon protease family protein [Cyclospora cayetanensis]
MALQTLRQAQESLLQPQQAHQIVSAASPPALPSLPAIGLLRRPAFPGFYQLLQIPDQQLFEELVRLKTGGGWRDFVGGFLVKKEPLNEEDLEPGARLREDAGPVSCIDEAHPVGCLLHLLTLAPHPTQRGGQAIVMPYRRIKLVGAAQCSDEPGAASEAAPRSEAAPSAQEDATAVVEMENTQEKPEGAVSTQGGEQEPLPAESEELRQQSADEGTPRGLGSLLPLPTLSGESSRGTTALLYVSVVFPEEAPAVSLSSSGGTPHGGIIKMLHLEILATMKELLKTSYFYKEHFDQVIRFYNLDYPQKLADLVAGMSFAKRDELQAVLAEEDIEKRLMLVLQIAKKDLEFAKLQVHVKAQVEDKMTRVQRKFLLQEQLKLIKKELGYSKDDKESILDAVTSELGKISSLDQASSEFHVSRTYLENLLKLPWGEYSKDCTDIEEAARVLDKDHFGLADVKRRILEFIAVTILKKDSQGKILCFVGPPGVGKTSVGESIARALQRKYYRICLGGMFDVAELRGHRRTYIGALPGKIIQALKVSESMNPLILLDEIDKLGRDFRGDPSSALLEVLDPSQNVSFRDFYLDVPVDLRKVLFVCTANGQDNIPGPLLDRMEIIRIAGYIHEEKIAIAQQYLIPKTAEATGLTDAQVKINPDALNVMVRDYAREAGVRSLSKCIDKLFRRAALSIVRKETEEVSIDENNLTKYVDQPPWSSSRLFEKTQPGIVMGLAWTSMGGAVIFVEAVGRVFSEGANAKSDKPNSKAGAGSLKVTGQLGGVMSESCDIAMTFARSFLHEIDPQNAFLSNGSIHLHVPEGATPKDGPSAGITLASALLSLALNVNPRPDLAMTGELTLTGKVLKVGGIKEKTLIFPKGNQRDFDELPDNVKANLEIHFVEDYQQVFDIAFGGQKAVEAAREEACQRATAAEESPERDPSADSAGAVQSPPSPSTPLAAWQETFELRPPR